MQILMIEDEPLRAGSDGHQAQRAEQSGKVGFHVGEGAGERVKSLLDLFGPAVNWATPTKLFILLASPTGFEPVLSP
jgi:hypothetical protein